MSQIYSPYMGGFSGRRPPTPPNPGEFPEVGNKQLLGSSGPMMPMMGPPPTSPPVMAAPTNGQSQMMAGWQPYGATVAPPMPMVTPQGQTPLQSQYGAVGTGQGYLLGDNHLATLGQAMQGDILTEQNYADQQYDRLGGIANEYGAGLKPGGQELRSTAAGSASTLGGLGEADLAYFEKYAARDQAQFKDLTAQKVMSVTDGLRSQLEERRMEIENGINPDGSQMTPQQKQAANNMLMREVNQQIGSTVAQIGGAYNDTARAAATAEMGQRVTMLERKGQLAAMAEQIRGAGVAAALNLELGGLMNLAEMVRMNPRTHVSRYAGLAEMFKNNMTQFQANQAVNMTARSVRNRNREAGAADQRGFKNFPKSGIPLKQPPKKATK